MKIIISEGTRNGLPDWIVTITFDEKGSHDDFFNVMEWLRENYIAEQDYNLGLKNGMEVDIFTPLESFVVAFKLRWL